MTAETAGALPGVSILTGDGQPPADAALLALAASHRLELLLYSRLVREERTASRVRAMAIAALDLAGERNKQFLGELHHLSERLAEAEIRALPLKGPLLAQFLWDDPALRRCRDIDILLPEGEIAKALPILEAAGYRAVSPPSALLRQVELWNESNRLTLDLHWNITHGELPFQLDFDRLWDERQEISYDGMTFPIASPEWLFMFSSLYLVKSHPWPELLYLSDLARLVHRFTHLDWGRIDEIARRTGTQRICCVALAVVESLGRCVIPAQARAHFPADRTVLALARRLGGAATRPATPDDPADLNAAAARRLRRLLAHARFRERPTDKARVGLGLLFLGFAAGGDIPGRSHTPLRLDRIACLGGAAAARAGTGLLQIASPRASALCPAEGIRFYPLEDAGVVLSIRQQALFALSPSAAFVWRALQDGNSPRKVVRLLAALSGQSVAEVGAQVADTLSQWRLNGLLGDSGSPDSAGDSGPSAPEAPVEKQPPPRGIRAPRRSLPLQYYRQLDTVFEIALPDDRLAVAVQSAIEHLATSEAPQIAVSVEPYPAGYLIVVDGKTEDYCATADSVVPTLKAILATTAINRTDFGLYIHGAMLRDGGNAVLLPAPPQSGKTCLAAALARRGLTFCTDETTLLDRHCFAARGLPAALAVKAAAWDLLQPLYPELRVLPAHRRADGKIVKYLPPPMKPGTGELDRPCRVRTIIFPRYVHDASNALVPLARVEALRLLMEECVAMRLGLEEDEVQGLIDWIAAISCYALTYSDLSAAVELVTPCLPGAVNWLSQGTQPRYLA